MKESEESKIKTQINDITKRINTILKNIEELSPVKEKNPDKEVYPPEPIIKKETPKEGS